MNLEGFCHINKEHVSLNGETVLSYNNGENWLKDIYQSLNVDYPKFHKMDDLAKMAFLSTEMLINKIDLMDIQDDELTLIFANNQSSYNTDNKFIESYKEKGNPSPSLFVYTLPNILTGELAIRHKWYGENIFFILKKFDEQFFIEQIKLYFSKGAKKCLCGWIEAVNNELECFIFVASNNGEELDKDKLIKTYKGNE